MKKDPADIFGVRPENRFKRKFATLKLSEAPQASPIEVPDKNPLENLQLLEESSSMENIPKVLSLELPQMPTQDTPVMRRFSSLESLTRPLEEQKAGMPMGRKAPEYASKDARKLARDLIAFAESNYGKNTRHPTIESGEQKGSRAVGTYGITPIVVQDIFKRYGNTPLAKVLKEQGYSGLSPQEISDKLEKDKASQELIVDHLINKLLKNQQGDPVRAAVQYMGNPDAPFQKDFSKAHPDLQKREQRILKHYQELKKTNK